MGKCVAEYSFAELIEDPLVGLVMKSDGVDRRSLELLLERVARGRARAAGVRCRATDKESRRCKSS